MNRPSLLITGAEGFIGRALRRRLAERYRLLSVDIRAPTPVGQIGAPVLQPDERCFQVDLGDLQAIDRLWRSLRDELPSVAGFIHLAAYYSFDNVPDPRYERLERGLEHLWPLIAADLPRQAVFVFASSMAAMAPTVPGRPLREESPVFGGWEYPRAKLRAEAFMAAHPLPVAVVQLVLAAVYSDDGELVPLFQTLELVRGRSPEKFVYPGPIDRGLTYVHIDEVTLAFERAIERFAGRPGVHRLLIGQSHPVTYRTLHRRASMAFHGRPLPLIRIPRLLAYAGAVVLKRLGRLLRRPRRFIQPWMIRFAGEHFEFDLSRTRDKLGWEPWHDLHQDLAALLERADRDRRRWLEKNRARPW